jgi:hypothetical protein
MTKGRVGIVVQPRERRNLLGSMLGLIPPVVARQPFPTLNHEAPDISKSSYKPFARCLPCYILTEQELEATEGKLLG